MGRGSRDPLPGAPSPQVEAAEGGAGPRSSARSLGEGTDGVWGAPPPPGPGPAAARRRLEGATRRRRRLRAPGCEPRPSPGPARPRPGGPALHPQPRRLQRGRLRGAPAWTPEGYKPGSASQTGRSLNGTRPPATLGRLPAPVRAPAPAQMTEDRRHRRPGARRGGRGGSRPLQTQPRRPSPANMPGGWAGGGSEADGPLVTGVKGNTWSPLGLCRPFWPRRTAGSAGTRQRAPLCVLR